MARPRYCFSPTPLPEDPHEPPVGAPGHGNPRRRARLPLRCLVYWGVALALVIRVPAVERAGVSVTLRTLQLVLGLFRRPIQRVGSALFVAGTSIQIVTDCSPHMSYLIYAAVVLAFPAPWRQRLLGLLGGAVVIDSFNTARILALIGILATKREWFEFAQVYLWQTGTVFAMFALWLRSTAPRTQTA